MSLVSFQPRGHVNGSSLEHFKTTLSTLSNDLVIKIISYAPDSIPGLFRVCRPLKNCGKEFLHLNAEKLIAHCSDRNLILHRVVKHIARYFHHGSGLQSDAVNLQFHRVLSTEIRLTLCSIHSVRPEVAQEVSVGGIPITEEIDRINPLVQESSDASLQKFWSLVIRNGVKGLIPKTLFMKYLVSEEALACSGLPSLNASAAQIRTWMGSPPGRAVLHKASELNMCDETGPRHIPSEAGSLTGLRRMYCARFPQYILPRNLFRGLSGLQCLHLIGIQLFCLQGDLFEGLFALKEIRIRNNPLTTFPENLFQGLTSLKEIDLFHNELDTLPQRPFHGLIHLTILDLSCNRLKNLPGSLLQGVNSTIQKLDLRDNPLRSLPKLSNYPMSLNLELTGADGRDCEWNPGQLIFGDSFPPVVERVSEMIQAFNGYRPVSFFAGLYQATDKALRGAVGVDIVQGIFQMLDAPTQFAISRCVWIEQGQPSRVQYREDRLFDSLPILGRALKNFTGILFASLTADEKEVVYTRVTRLVRMERGIPDDEIDWVLDCECPVNWGRRHVGNNILRFIDAMIPVWENRVRGTKRHLEN